MLLDAPIKDVTQSYRSTIMERENKDLNSKMRAIKKHSNWAIALSPVKFMAITPSRLQTAVFWTPLVIEHLH